MLCNKRFSVKKRQPSISNIKVHVVVYMVDGALVEYKSQGRKRGSEIEIYARYIVYTFIWLDNNKRDDAVQYS